MDTQVVEHDGHCPERTRDSPRALALTALGASGSAVREAV
jgi:hypothetical protein